MLMLRFIPRLSLPLGSLVCLAGLLACDGGLRSSPVDEPGTENGLNCTCTVPSGNCENAFVDSGVSRDGIPALRNPDLAPADAARLDQGGYLADSSRVIGLLVDGHALAVPHNILRHHEIANLTINGKNLAVTYCPLTGSALAFNRSPVDGANFLVSGLLFKNNLVMIEESADESLWPQMNREANCGPKAGASLVQWPVVDLQWGRWTALYPDTKVIAKDTGFDFNYDPSANPYEGYERPTNDDLFVPMPIDERRPPKERVLGLPQRQGGLAYPFQELAEAPQRVLSTTLGDKSVVVFWNRSAWAAMAYVPTADGRRLSFEVRNGTIIDTQTESTWSVTGHALSGPLVGAQLAPIEEAYTAFWFAWAAFQPDTELWTAD